MKKVVLGIVSMLVVASLAGCSSQSAAPASSQSADAASSASAASVEAQSSEAAESQSAEAAAAESQSAEAVESQDAASASDALYADGTYTGIGLGKEGPINVTLTIADGVITIDEITDSGETEGIGGKEAIEDGTFKAQIEEAQSAEIDGVTGATLTSDGVRAAVEDALAQALAA